MVRPPRHSLLTALGLAALFAAGVAPQAEAQFGRRLKDAVKRNAEDKAIQKAVDKENDAIDGATTGGGDTAGAAAAPAESTATTGKAAPAANAAAAPAAPGAADAAAPAAAPLAKPGEGAWANYDFKPGERVLFFDDFAKEEVGNFPSRMEFKNGNLEIVEWQGQRWLKSGDRGEFSIPLSEALPERFTLEFDLAGSGNGMEIWFTDNHNGAEVQHITFRADAGGITGMGVDAVGSSGFHTDKEPVKARIMADGKYVKVFVNEKRVANVPNANLGRSKKIDFLLNGWSEDEPRMIANVRIAAGGRKLYDALAAKGRVATQGIYFDTGSDRIRPESTPTLKEIGTMLKEHADLKLTIEGHTDNVGTAEANRTLSEKRAAAVRQFLVANYGIDGARLQAKGLGQTKPTASNDTPEGRQQNRRVELVKS